MGVHKATIEQAGAKRGGTGSVAIEVDDQPLPAETRARRIVSMIAALEDRAKTKPASGS